jgi:protein Mpv17
VAYLLYGSLYQGVAQEYIYNHLYPVWFGAGNNIQTVFSKVAFDVTIQTCFVTLPIAYLAKASIFQYSAGEAFRRYWDDIRNHGLLKKYISLWAPVNSLTFSVIPVHYRVSFIAFVSFFWLIILSSIASRQRIPTEVNEDADAVEVTLQQEECVMSDGLTCNIDG